jgi:hypothetical protein
VLETCVDNVNGPSQLGEGGNMRTWRDKHYRDQQKQHVPAQQSPN